MLLPSLALACAALGGGAAMSSDVHADDDGTTVGFRAIDAPLSVVLAEIARGDGRALHLGEAIDAIVVDEWIGGERESVLLSLAATHDLSLYRDADGLWVDRRDRPAVEFVALSPERIGQAIGRFGIDAPGEDGVAIAVADGGVAVSGSRAFVRRTVAALGALPDATPPVPTAAGEGLATPLERDVVAAPAAGEASGSGVGDAAAARSVTDIPGFYPEFR